MVGAPDRRGREGLCHDLSLRPMSANRKVAIIDDADRMNEESANALLKTLEEPPAGSILFLITPSIEPILPTIRSRCQPIRFGPLAESGCGRSAPVLLEWVADPQTAAIGRASEAKGASRWRHSCSMRASEGLRSSLDEVLRNANGDAIVAAKKVTEAVEELAKDLPTSGGMRDG
ncbi:MAG: hypothetical protein QM820_43285 [Minicystis sp.]